MREPLCVDKASDLARYLHQPLGPTEWRRVGQSTIDAFAELTGDGQWIHVDPRRAAEELPGGRTIVPGHLLLALLPQMIRETYLVSQVQSSYLAALRSVRFRQVVECDVPFRLSGRLLKVTTRGRAVFAEMRCALTLSDEAVALEANCTNVFNE